VLRSGGFLALKFKRSTNVEPYTNVSAEPLTAILPNCRCVQFLFFLI